MQSIPTIDLSPLRDPEHADHASTIAAILDACTDIGFLSITGTGIAPQTVDQVRQTCREIFSIEESSKWQQAITRNNYRGYIPMGFFTPNDGSGTADKYEGYKLHHEVTSEDPIRQDCAL